MRSKDRPDKEPDKPAVTIRPAAIPTDEYDRRIGEAVGIALAAIERETTKLAKGNEGVQ